MEKRFLTLFVMTNDASRSRQFRLSIKALKIGAACVGVAALLLFYSLVDYARLKSNTKELYALREENTAQRIELQGFSAKLRDIEAQLARLNVFDRKLRIIANIAEPKGLDPAGQLKGVGGGAPPDADEYMTSSAARFDGLVREMKGEMTQLAMTATVQEKSFTELQAQLARQSVSLASTPSIWPLKGWLTSQYGQRISPFTGLPQLHKGIDIANRMGAPVVAPADGVVTRVVWENGLGKTVTIRHGSGVETDFGHLSEAFVRPGQRVKRGMKIASVGNTGHSTGPHLHYEVSVNGMSVNPMKYILN